MRWGGGREKETNKHKQTNKQTNKQTKCKLGQHYDVITYLNKEKLPGLLLPTDVEKAFDSRAFLGIAYGCLQSGSLLPRFYVFRMLGENCSWEWLFVSCPFCAVGARCYCSSFILVICVDWFDMLSLAVIKNYSNFKTIVRQKQ